MVLHSILDLVLTTVSGGSAGHSHKYSPGGNKANEQDHGLRPRHKPCTSTCPQMTAWFSDTDPDLGHIRVTDPQEPSAAASQDTVVIPVGLI